MGWTFTHRPKGQSTIEFFRQEFDHQYGHVLDAATRSFTEVYIAYQVLDRQTGEASGVIGIVCLTRWRHRDRFNFGYKQIEEGAGPVCCDCPGRILDQLTAFDFGSERANQYSREWRRKCRERLRRRQARPSLRADDLIWFPQPIQFTSGAEHQVLQVYHPRRLEFASPGSPRASYKLRRDSLDGARVIASTAPGAKGARHPALDELVGRYGPDEVGSAYRHVLEEAPLQIWRCVRDPAAAGEKIAELMESVIDTPSPTDREPHQVSLLNMG